MQLFYSPDIPPSGFFTLDAEESRHCLRVLRKRVGDSIEVVDGKGNLYQAEIVSDKSKLCELKVIGRQSDYGTRHFRLSIALAIPKNAERFEWFIEKAAEIGIDEIFPMLTEKTERAKLNAVRMNKILVSAMKQSGKTFLPALHEPKPFAEIISAVAEGTQKFIAVCDWEGERKNLKQAYQKGKNAFVLIGPEGDFSLEEVKLAVSKGFHPVSLGKSRLRVETAGMVACSTINLLND